MSVYVELFLAFLQIGAFSFGGGYAAMPLIQEQVVEKYGWLSLSDFTGMTDVVRRLEKRPPPRGGWRAKRDWGSTPCGTGFRSRRRRG